MLKKFFAAILVCSLLLIGAQARSDAAVATNWQEENLLPVTTGQWHWARVVNCNEWISLRAYPSTSASRRAQIPLGTLVKIYRGQLGEQSGSPSNGFYYTEYEGMTGWCLQEYIRVGEVASVVH